jgi:hypothetical protein
MLRIILVAIIAAFTVVSTSAAFELTGETKQVGPEVSSVPFWDRVVVQQGDTLARACTAFLQGKELPFTVDQCVGGITTINPKLAGNPELIRVGETVWVMSERNTRDDILVQFEERQQLAVLAPNPLVLTAMVGTVSDRLNEVEAATATAQATAEDAATAAQAAADTAMSAQDVARIAAQGVAANTARLRGIDARSDAVEGRLSAVEAGLTNKADQKFVLAELNNKADATGVDTRFNAVESDLKHLAPVASLISWLRETPHQLARGVGLGESVVEWYIPELWAVVIATALIVLLIIAVLVRYIVWRPMRWIVRRMNFRRSPVVETSTPRAEVLAGTTTSHDPLLDLTFEGPEGEDLQIALRSANQSDPVIWKWKAPNGIVRYQVRLWPEGDMIASTVRRKVGEVETVRYRFKKLSPSRIEEAIMAGRVPPIEPQFALAA